MTGSSTVAELTTSPTNQVPAPIRRIRTIRQRTDRETGIRQASGSWSGFRPGYNCVLARITNDSSYHHAEETMNNVVAMNDYHLLSNHMAEPHVAMAMSLANMVYLAPQTGVFKCPKPYSASNPLLYEGPLRYPDPPSILGPPSSKRPMLSEENVDLGTSLREGIAEQEAFTEINRLRDMAEAKAWYTDNGRTEPADWKSTPRTLPTTKFAHHTDSRLHSLARSHYADPQGDYAEEFASICGATNVPGTQGFCLIGHASPECPGGTPRAFWEQWWPRSTSTMQPYHPGHDPHDRPGIWELSANQLPASANRAKARTQRRKQVIEDLQRHPDEPSAINSLFWTTLDQWGPPTHMLQLPTHTGPLPLVVTTAEFAPPSTRRPQSPPVRESQQRPQLTLRGPGQRRGALRHAETSLDRGTDAGAGRSRRRPNRPRRERLHAKASCGAER